MYVKKILLHQHFFHPHLNIHERNFVLKPIHNLTNKIDTRIYCDNVNNVANKCVCNVIYLDPPYNSRQYSKNYHLLNIIANNNDNYINNNTVTGLLENSFISNYCKKQKIKNEFIDLIKKLKADYIFISYNNEGLLSQDELIKILQLKGNVEVFEIEYKKYKSQKNIEKEKTTEYLFCVEVN